MMKEEPSRHDEGPLIPATGEEVIGRVAPLLPETPTSMPGAPAPMPRPLIPKLPRLIYQIANHDYSSLSAVIAALASPQDSLGMQFSVECSEYSLTPQTLAAAVQVVEPESRHYFLAVLQQDYSMCQLWNVQPVPVAQQQPVTSAIPTLILSGEYDPVTPPAYGMLAARTLSKSYYFSFPGVRHVVVGANSCATSMFRAFLEFPNGQPDATCMSGVGEPLFE